VAPKPLLPPPDLPTPCYGSWRPASREPFSAQRAAEKRRQRGPESAQLTQSGELEGRHTDSVYRAAPVVPPRPRREERPRRLAQGCDLEALPALASDEVLEAWRLRMVDSALRFARLSDVPHSMLARCGAISLV